MTENEAIAEMMAMLKTTNKMGAVFQGRPDIGRRKEAYVMAIQALQKESAYEQMKWERDIAISQLKEISLELGEKTDKVKSAIETARKIPEVIERLEKMQDISGWDLLTTQECLKIIKENLWESDWFDPA